ncbi:MAG: response regulator [Burkholderiales bacterium]|nr:response regulator [Burkholderiales bacterium]
MSAPPRVMVVDDNAMNVVLAQTVLEADGLSVAAAANAAEALALLGRFAPDLLLMDIQLPGMDGLALARQLKADPATRHIVIVAFTAFAMRGDEERMRSAGCDGYISKPINVHLFAAQVRACLEAARQAGG